MAPLTYEKNVSFFRWALIKGLTETNLVGFFVPVGSVSTQSFFSVAHNFPTSWNCWPFSGNLRDDLRHTNASQRHHGNIS